MATLGNIGLRSWQYRLRATIPQSGSSKWGKQAVYYMALFYFKFAALWEQKHKAHYFHVNGLYGKIPTK